MAPVASSAMLIMIILHCPIFIRSGIYPTTIKCEEIYFNMPEMDTNYKIFLCRYSSLIPSI